MNKLFALLLLIPLFFGCDGSVVRYNNPNIPNYAVNLQINLNLPSYSNLQFPGNYILDYSQGARGVVVFNTGSGFNAFDLACPNQSFSTCTTPMAITGIEAKCSCDNTVYSLYSGQCPGQTYLMKQYRVDVNGSYLTVYN